MHPRPRSAHQTCLHGDPLDTPPSSQPLAGMFAAASPAAPPPGPATPQPGPAGPITFGADTPGSAQMMRLLDDDKVGQITVNAHDRIWYTTPEGTRHINVPVFPSADAYIAWLNALLKRTDSVYDDVASTKAHVIEASFTHGLRGSIHLCTSKITRGEPTLTIRKQPTDRITLDDMLVRQHMMSDQMYETLIGLINGRANILLSGGSGAGKTTMARALSAFIDAEERVITCEEIAELHLGDWLPQVVPLTTYTYVDPATGEVVREIGLEQLVKETLRMRPDRIWVGETRGAEAAALVKACNSGHAGSLTTVHGDNAQQAVKQVTTYVEQSGIPEASAKDQVLRAFDVIVQINRVSPVQRVISEITELESVRDGGAGGSGGEARLNPLFKLNMATGQFEKHGNPTPMLRQRLALYDVKLP